MIYTPIKADEEFNKEAFLEAAQSIHMLNHSLEAMLKDPTAPTPFKNLGNILYEAQDFFFNQENPALMARSASELAIKEGSNSLEKYVKKDSAPVYSMLNTNKKALLLQKAKLQKAADKEENMAYNEFVKLKEEADKLEEAQADPQKKVEYLSKKMKTEPKWAQEIMSLYQGNNKYIEAIFGDYVQMNRQQMSEILFNKEGKLNGKIINYLADKSLEAAKSAEKDKGYFKILAEIASIQDNAN